MQNAMIIIMKMQIMHTSFLIKPFWTVTLLSSANSTVSHNLRVELSVYMNIQLAILDARNASFIKDHF